MVKQALSTAASLLVFAATALGACNTISYTTCADKIVHWYDPTNGEVCDPLDCGGGRAPVKYDVPCCAAYTGTEPCVSTTSTLSCWTPATVSASSTTSASLSSVKTTSTTTATETHSGSSTGSTTSSLDSASGSSTPSTTSAPTRPATSAEGSNSSAVASGTSSSQPVSTNVAAGAGGVADSLMAIAAAAIPAFILV